MRDRCKAPTTPAAAPVRQRTMAGSTLELVIIRMATLAFILVNIAAPAIARTAPLGRKSPSIARDMVGMAMQTAGMIIIPIVPLATKIDCKDPGDVNATTGDVLHAGGWTWFGKAWLLRRSHPFPRFLADASVGRKW